MTSRKNHIESTSRKATTAGARTFLWYWVPPLAGAAAIFVQSSFRMPIQPPSGFGLGDKVLHAGVYAVLAWLTYRAFRGARGMPPLRAAWWAFALTALYGATDEIHQGLVPSRTMELGDWIADMAGAATVFLALPGRRVLRPFVGTPPAPPG